MKNPAIKFETVEPATLENINGGVQWGQAWNQANSWGSQAWQRTASPTAAAGSWGAGLAKGVWDTWGK